MLITRTQQYVSYKGLNLLTGRDTDKFGWLQKGEGRTVGAVIFAHHRSGVNYVLQGVAVDFAPGRNTMRLVSLTLDANVLPGDLASFLFRKL